MSGGSSGGNGLLYVGLAVGVLMVGAGVALEVMPDELPVREQDVVTAPVYVPPAPPPPVYEPPPPPVQAPIEPTRTVLWHVEAPGEPPVACVLHAEATASGWRPSGALGLVCADGRGFTGAVSGGRLTGRRLESGVSFRAELPAVAGSDHTGSPATVRVDTSGHWLFVDGSSTLPSRLYVEELSIPDAAFEGEVESVWVERAVRLAVPTMVTGPIPVSIAMVRGTGRAPRPGEPVCELTASPAVSSGHNCRVLLRCHGEIVYGEGTSGYNACALEGTSFVSASDTGVSAEDTDPRMELDLPAGTLTVSDDTVEGSWSATFELMVDPRLGVDVEYAGGYRGETSGSWALRPFAAPATIAFDDAVEPLAATAARLGNGQYSIRTDGVESGALVFGPGARSIAGTVRGRAVWGFAR